LAKAVGVSQAYLAQVEGAKRTGEIGLYRRLAAKLGLEIEDLLPPSDSGRPARKRRK
jgi:transcriptional regulator with XRE-family HTH domain